PREDSRPAAGRASPEGGPAARMGEEGAPPRGAPTFPAPAGAAMPTRPPPPDWRLPPGVGRGLWDYLHDPAVARGYDAALAGSALLRADQDFVGRHCPRPGRLIDLGCGTGRLLLPFARRGFWVLGVDLSAEMLKVAREK